MKKGRCHCGAVEIELGFDPVSKTLGNCTVCRRLAPLWIYGDPSSFRFTMSRGATSQYIQGDKTLALHFCKICGTTTHWENLGLRESSTHMAVNARLFDDVEIDNLPVRRFDCADTWQGIDN